MSLATARIEASFPGLLSAILNAAKLESYSSIEEDTPKKRTKRSLRFGPSRPEHLNQLLIGIPVDPHSVSHQSPAWWRLTEGHPRKGPHKRASRHRRSKVSVGGEA